MTSKHAMIGTDKDNSEVFFGKEYLIINLVIILIYLNYYCHFLKSFKLISILPPPSVHHCRCKYSSNFYSTYIHVGSQTKSNLCKSYSLLWVSEIGSRWKGILDST